jgi:hypothetical protein
MSVKGKGSHEVAALANLWITLRSLDFNLNKMPCGMICLAGSRMSSAGAPQVLGS